MSRRQQWVALYVGLAAAATATSYLLPLWTLQVTAPAWALAGYAAASWLAGRQRGAR